MELPDQCNISALLHNETGWLKHERKNANKYKTVIEGLRERTEHLDIFHFSAHHSVVIYFQCFVYWWKGVPDFSVLKYY